jgi:hypothetical protein
MRRVRPAAIRKRLVMIERQAFLDSAAKKHCAKACADCARCFSSNSIKPYAASTGWIRTPTRPSYPRRAAFGASLDDWLDEHERAVPAKKGTKPAEMRRRALDQAVKEARSHLAQPPGVFAHLGAPRFARGH